MKIFVINGSGGSGKDTFVKLVSGIVQGIDGDIGNKTRFPVNNISTIDPIKDLAIQAGWDGRKDDVSRKFLSDLKDLCTNVYDTSYNYVKSIIESRIKHDAECKNVEHIIFIHCREPKEIERLVKNFDARTILIDSSKRIDPINSNHADSNVWDYNYDIIINNDGSRSDLAINAAHFVKDCLHLEELL